MLPDWCAAYVGLPYVYGARGPEAYDCWGLVAHVLRTRFGVEPPPVDAPPEKPDKAARGQMFAAGAASGEWGRVAHRECLRSPMPAFAERPGDVVLIRRGIWPAHCGIVVAPNWMIHTLDEVGCFAERLRGGGEDASLLAIYRHRDLQ